MSAKDTKPRESGAEDPAELARRIRALKARRAELIQKIRELEKRRAEVSVTKRAPGNKPSRVRE